MHSFLASLAVLVAPSLALQSQFMRLVPPPPPPPPEGQTDHNRVNAVSLLETPSDDSPTFGQGTFQQLLNHSDPTQGTFTQQYLWSSTFYQGPNSPIILTTPGESAMKQYTGLTRNDTIMGAFAQDSGGAVVVLEHRYWGESSPFTNLTVDTLQHLTLENAIADLVYFAETVQLPFDTTDGAGGGTSPSTSPWILSGGSYAGALSAWTAAVKPGTFWAYHATSAVVEAVEEFWQYDQGPQLGMATNCSADVHRVVDYVDHVLTTGSDNLKHLLKELFGLADLEYDDDFVSVLAQGPMFWQVRNFAAGYTVFEQFCDYVENRWPNSTDPQPGPDGVGLEMALKGYSKWTREVLIPNNCEAYGYSGSNNTDCFNTHDVDSQVYTDDSVSNRFERQWQWMLCNEPFGWWPTSAPSNESSLFSRLITLPYFTNQCSLYFPDTPDHVVGIAAGKDSSMVNSYTGGWDNLTTQRVLFVNGEWDPWRPATISATGRPGGPVPSSEDRPVLVIPKGMHCSDVYLQNGRFDAGLQGVIDQERDIMKKWIQEFYDEKGIQR